jgi:polysaccharide export outer membrane protein
MTTIRSSSRSSRGVRPGGRAALALALLLAASLVGCQAVDFYDPSLERQTPAAVEPPRELAKMSLPAYRIEPPDTVTIDILKVVPLPPYRVDVYDVLQISVVGTLQEQPINGYYILDAEGRISLGPAYGQLRVAGMTVPEIQRALAEYLGRILASPEVSVQLAQAAGTQPIGGQYLVGPDGCVNLRQYGSVHLAGLTLAEAKLAVERHLSQYLDHPVIWIDVAGYNSKVYYIVTEGAGMGDNLVRMPITGNETLLDAMSQVQGLSQLSSKRIWIARPAPAGFHCEQILPVDWNAITRGAATATNYQVLPGDRIFIAEDKAWALTNYLAKVTAPIERIAGASGLFASTIRQFNFINRQTGHAAGF